MHPETIHAVGKFIELVRERHPEDVARLQELLYPPAPVFDSAPDSEPPFEEPREPEPEQWEIDATFSRQPDYGAGPPGRVGSSAPTTVLTDTLLDLAKQRRFPFGKHGPKSGMAKTVYEVYLADPSYLQWAVDQCENLDFQLRQIITALIEAEPVQNYVNQTRSSRGTTPALPEGWGPQPVHSKT